MEKLDFSEKNQHIAEMKHIKILVLNAYIKFLMSFYLVLRLMTLNDIGWLFEVT